MFSFLLTTTMARPWCKPWCAGNNVHEWKDLTPVGSARALCIVVYPRDHVSQTRWPVCSQLQRWQETKQLVVIHVIVSLRDKVQQMVEMLLIWKQKKVEQSLELKVQQCTVCSQCFGNKFPPIDHDVAKLTAEESLCTSSSESIFMLYDFSSCFFLIIHFIFCLLVIQFLFCALEKLLFWMLKKVFFNISLSEISEWTPATPESWQNRWHTGKDGGCNVWQSWAPSRCAVWMGYGKETNGPIQRLVVWIL